MSATRQPSLSPPEHNFFSLDPLIVDSGTISKTGDACKECASGTFKALDGTSTCTSCPANSNTVVWSKGCGSSGAACTDPSDCVCKPGYFGTIKTAADKCTVCAVGEYKQVTDVTPCSKCPADSTTKATASTEIQDCLCNAGHSGILTKAADTCKDCPIGQYDDGTKATDTCTACPTVTTFSCVTLT